MLKYVNAVTLFSLLWTGYLMNHLLKSENTGYLSWALKLTCKYIHQLHHFQLYNFNLFKLDVLMLWKNCGLWPQENSTITLVSIIRTKLDILL